MVFVLMAPPCMARPLLCVERSTRLPGSRYHDGFSLVCRCMWLLCARFARRLGWHRQLRADAASDRAVVEELIIVDAQTNLLEDLAIVSARRRCSEVQPQRRP